METVQRPSRRDLKLSYKKAYKSHTDLLDYIMLEIFLRMQCYYFCKLRRCWINILWWILPILNTFHIKVGVNKERSGYIENYEYLFYFCDLLLVWWIKRVILTTYSFISTEIKFDYYKIFRAKLKYLKKLIIFQFLFETTH